MLDRENSFARSPEQSHSADAYLRGVGGLKGSSAKAFAEVANQFSSEILVRWEGRIADGKSAAELMNLSVESGQVIRITTRGRDAERALTALEEAVMAGLESDDELLEERVLEGFEKSSDVRSGMPASPGIAIASSFLWNPPEVSVSSLSEGYQKERNKFLSALIGARQELQKLLNESLDISASPLAEIFSSQLAELDDPHLLEETDALIREGYSAMEGFAQVVQKIETSTEIEQRVLNLLSGYGTAQRARVLPEHPIILVAKSLSPSDYSLLDPERVAAVVLESDPTKSIALKLLRIKGIPCVAQLGASLHPFRSGTPLIVDGDSGTLVLHPNAESYRKARELMQVRIDKKEKARLEALRPKKTEMESEYFANSIEHFTVAARMAVELDIPPLSTLDLKRSGASRDLSDEIAIDRPMSEPKARKKGLWEQIFGRK